MRPIPPNQTYGVIYTVNITQEQADKLAELFGIPDDKKKWLAGEIHIVREGDTLTARRPQSP